MNGVQDPVLPWLESAWQQLGTALSLDRVAPALLIRGPSGIGKTLLARQYARRLLCRTPDEAGGCGACRSCRMFEAGTHPDFLEIKPEEPGKPIRIDVIRALTSQIALTPHFGGYRVALIDRVDALNQNAANAFLKTLEEPPEGTVLILVTQFPERLPATLRSRCSTIGLARPPRAMALAWLQSQGVGEDAPRRLAAANGSPLGALALDEAVVLEKRSAYFSDFVSIFEGHKDPVDVAEAWAAHLGESELCWLMAWVAEMIRIALAPAWVSEEPSRDLEPALRRIQQQTTVHFLLESHSRLLRCHEALQGPSNRQLALEAVLLPWARGRSQTRPRATP